MLDHQANLHHCAGLPTSGTVVSGTCECFAEGLILHNSLGVALYQVALVY